MVRFLYGFGSQCNITANLEQRKNFILTPSLSTISRVTVTPVTYWAFTVSPPWATFRKGCWGGDELSFAASSLWTPHSPSLWSHLRCPFLCCWSQTVLGSATQRSDHRWGTPHLRTSPFMQHHLPEASIRAWEDAHRIEWLGCCWWRWAVILRPGFDLHHWVPLPEPDL